MDMSWDQIATLAQLVTGAATLAVAIFLWSQLKVQHRDSERDFAFANETKQQDLFASWYSDESACNLLWKAYNSYESLSPEEVHRFRLMYQQMYLHQLNAWRLKRDGDDLRMAIAVGENSRVSGSASLFGGIWKADCRVGSWFE